MVAATSSQTSASVASRSGTLLEPDAGVGDRVRDVCREHGDYVEHGAYEHHGPYDRKILRLDGFDREAAEARYPKERFGEQAAHEQERDRRNHAGENRDQRVPKDVPEEDDAFGEPFRARRAHVLLADFLQEHGPVEAAAHANAADDADHDGKNEKPGGIKSALESGNGHQVPDFRNDVLPPDDVEKHRYGHHDDA